MSRPLSVSPYVRGTLAAVAATVVACGGGNDGRVDVVALESALEKATGITLRPAPAVDTPPGIPSLASSRSGGSRRQSLLLLEFFDVGAVRQAVGDLRRLGRTEVLRRRNVVVLYTRASGAPDRLSAVQFALERLTQQNDRR